MTRRVRLALVVAASLAAHLKGIASPLLDYHYHRQCNTAAIARNFHRGGLDILKPQVDWEGPQEGRAATELPVYMWLVGLLWPVGGLGELWGRLLSVLFSALTAVYLVLFLERELEPEAAFYAGLLFSFIPLEVYFGRTVQPEAISLFGTMASLYHWDRWLGGRRGWHHWALAVLFAFLAIGHKLPYAYILLPLAYLAWLRRGPEALKNAGVWLAPLAAGLGVWTWYRYASSGVYVVPSHPGEFTSILNYARLPFFVQFQALSRFPELATTYGGLVLFALGLRELVFRRGKAFYAAWFGVIWAFLIAGGGYSFYHEYTSLPLAPVNAAFMGLGLVLLKRKVLALRGEVRTWAWAGLSLLVLSIPVHSALRIRHWYRNNYPFLARAKQAADQVSAPGDLFLANTRSSSVYLFYLDRKGWSWDLEELGPSHIGWVEDKIRRGARFFATAKEGPFKGRTGFYAEWFYSRFPVVYDRDGLLIFKLR